MLFLTPRIYLVFGLSALVGVTQFAVELFLAALFQLLVANVGAQTAVSAPPSLVPFPSIVSSAGFAGLMCAIIVLVICRATAEWTSGWLQARTVVLFSELQYRRLIDWLVDARAISSGRFYKLFGQYLEGSGTVVESMQVFVRQLFLGLMLGSTLFYFSGRLTLSIVLLLAVMALPFRRAVRKASEEGRKIGAEWSKLYALVARSLRNLLFLRIQGVVESEAERADRHLQILKRRGLVQAKLTATVNTYFYLVATLVVGIVLAFNHFYGSHISGIVLPYFYLLNRFIQSVIGSLGAVGNIAPRLHYLRDFSAWWSERRAVPTATEKGALTRARCNPTGAIGWSLRSVTFGYPGQPQAVLQSLDMEISPGSTVFITGASGAGKSTLLSVLLGEAAPQSGSVDVVFNDKRAPLSECVRTVLPQIGYVGAESFLIEGTIFENLTYGIRGDVSLMHLDEVLKQAKCEFIYELRNGIEERITEQGEGLSAGQKQRLCLARALLRKPRVLILDEPTANLDEETEIQLTESLARLRGRLTLICCTHRKALLTLADEVFVMQPIRSRLGIDSQLRVAAA